MQLRKLHFFTFTFLLFPLLLTPWISMIMDPILVIDTSEDQAIPPPAAPFDNIILMIGDGMSWAQINATKKWLGPTINLTMDELTHLGDIATYSLDSAVTDSAAAATALATGNRTNNNMVSMLPGGEILTTIIEAAEALGKATGIVTTTPISHGTGGPFAAHVPHRADQETIAGQQISKGIEVLLGGGMSFFSYHLATATSLGYTIVENRNDMLSSISDDHLLGLFADGSMNYEYDRDPLLEPHIAEMTNASLQILDRETDGFFLMVEGGRIDHACHDWNINRTIGETIAFDEAVQVAYDYAQTHAGTLLIVTADHETGGLWVNMTNPVLDYQFTNTYHTATPVPLLVYHNTSTIFPTFNHLTDVGRYLFEAFDLVPGHLPLEWTYLPSNQQVEFGDAFANQLSTFSINPIDNWWINDTIHFSIDNTGLIQNTTPLMVGDYGIQVNVNDTSGFTISTSFQIQIRDTTAPTWVNTPSDQILEYGTDLILQLNVTDRSGIDQWLVNDTTNFQISSSGLLESTTGVTGITYGVNVTAVDPYGNAASVIFRVTFQESTVPPPAIPGFPFAAIIIGLTLTCSIVLLVRRKTRPT
ncbi:MAG: alkaline phosphatase [Promethearchaeota archaeon]